VSGDSGNDVALFTVAGVRGCVVANAHPELLEWQQRHGEQGRVLLVGEGAVTDPWVYRPACLVERLVLSGASCCRCGPALQASQPCAAGILEALRHFGTLRDGGGCSGRQGALGALRRLLGFDAPCGSEPRSAGSLLRPGSTLVGPSAVGAAAASSVEQLRLAAMAAAGGSASGCAVQWLDQVFVQELPGGVWVAGGLACCMDAQRSRRAATAIACSVVLQRAGAVDGAVHEEGDVGAALQVVHLHWHALGAAVPRFQ
jgi:hypothetical protein